MKKSFTDYCWWTGLVILVILIAWQLADPSGVNHIDQSIRLVVNAHRSAVQTGWWTTITKLYNFGWACLWIILTISAAWWLVNRLFFAQLFLTILSGLFLNRLIKEIVQRPRPSSNILMHYAGYSFPSGHSSTAALVGGSLILLTWRVCQHTNLKWLLTVLWGLMILLVGYSRVYVGAHFPTDVLAGWALGIWVVTTFDWLWNHYFRRQSWRLNLAHRYSGPSWSAGTYP